jgi:hypothetical protein
MSYRSNRTRRCCAFRAITTWTSSIHRSTSGTFICAITPLKGFWSRGTGGPPSGPRGYPNAISFATGRESALTTARTKCTVFHRGRPDIIVSHQPAHGIHDRLSFVGPSGSRRFGPTVMRTRTALPYGTHPQRLGHGDQRGDDSPQSVTVRRGNGITGDVLEAGFSIRLNLKAFGRENRLQKNGRRPHIRYHRAHTAPREMAEEIIDASRHDALTRRENFDSKIRKYSHIPEIRLFNEINSFSGCSRRPNRRTRRQDGKGRAPHRRTHQREHRHGHRRFGQCRPLAAEF